MPLRTTYYLVQEQTENGEAKNVPHGMNGVTGEEYHRFLSKDNAMEFLRFCQNENKGTPYRLVRIKKTIDIYLWSAVTS